MKPPVALTIAGTDSGGGAGVPADLKTFEAHGVWGTCAVVAVTAQNTVGVHQVTFLHHMVRPQVEAVVTDIGVDAAKTGMLANTEGVLEAAKAIVDFGVAPLVVDPVLVSKHGDPLLFDDALDAMRDELFPAATVLTPNLPEAAAITGAEITGRDGMLDAARALLDLGPRVVMLKGGHLDGDASPDLILARGDDPLWLEAPRIQARHTHGTGCVLSAAITAELARGMEPVDACIAAKAFVTRAIAAGVDLGAGVGPVDPGWERHVRPC
jgi:hydroxymethylpyrimidine/phosphomethylpyrimidine kinase